MAIRFLIMSDTHDTAFPPPHQTQAPDCQVDVVLHCGDLTMIGGLSNYRKAIKDLADCDAELKLVIPGNHDVSLDPKWWANNLDVEDDGDPEEPQKALALFSEAASTGIGLLGEGLHRFTLRDGRSFSIYTSPYTPEFNGYAFAYKPEEPKFSIASIPKGVDIVMTHGPPQAPLKDYCLDLAKGTHCGCPVLWEAIAYAKPRLHCFGHIHDGHGVQIVNWNDSTTVLEEVPGDEEQKTLSVPASGQTMLINAAIMTHGEGDNNAPWVVEV